MPKSKPSPSVSSPSTSAPPLPTTITLADFHTLLSTYDTLITSLSNEKKPPRGNDDQGLTLKELDDWRLWELPQVVEGRRKKGMGGGGKKKKKKRGDEMDEVGPWLEKDEVVRLVRWKLTHGHFRPSLLQLTSSNPAPLIKSTTQAAFALLSSSTSPSPLPPTTKPTKPKDPRLLAIATLTTLRGIGPATASLLLSVVFPTTVPFFSDELFRWVTYSDSPGKGASDKGWARKIKYSPKELERLFEGCDAVREKLEGDGDGDGDGRKREVWARDVERVGYVLGMTGVGRGGVEKGGGDEVVMTKGRGKRVKRKVVEEGDTTDAGEVAEEDIREKGFSPPPVRKRTRRKAG
ncbi:MAG: hypothetical protein M1817_000431 [Caeruleum heppii]|nr:MAG: hypothetical protein M1817_000431 [Caeruleum heppii]